MAQPTNSPTSLPDLPPELQGRIIAAVSHRIDPSRALEPALVCRKWSHLAGALPGDTELARTWTEKLEITSSRQMRDFPMLLRELTPWASGLRSLILSNHNSGDVVVPESAVRELLELCRDLQYLCLGGEIFQESLGEENEGGRCSGKRARTCSVQAGPLPFPLKYLYLSHGSSSSLQPLLPRLPHLRTLELHDPPFDMTHLRTWCPRLRVLRLISGYDLEVPLSISLLVGLTELDIFGYFSEIPDIRPLSSLKKLMLCGDDGFHTIPDLRFQIHLEYLDLGGWFGPIPDLPCFETLRTLILDSYPLHRVLPQKAALPKLKHLRLGGCTLPSLSSEQWDLPSLNDLILGHHEWDRVIADALPASLHSCRALSSVTLQGELDSLSSNITQSTSLCSLDLSELELATLPDDITLNLPHLTELRINCQHLGLMQPRPQSELPKLRVLFVKCNAKGNDGVSRECYGPTKLPLWLTQMTTLTKLDISKCSCLVSFAPALLELPHLDSKSRDGLKKGWVVTREGTQS